MKYAVILSLLVLGACSPAVGGRLAGESGCVIVDVGIGQGGQVAIIGNGATGHSETTSTTCSVTVTAPAPAVK